MSLNEIISSEKQAVSVLGRLPFICLCISAGISAVSLIAWFTGAMIFARFSLKYIPIAPSTAVVFLLLSLSLLYYLYRPERPSGRPVAAMCAAVVLLLCSIILAGFFLGKSFDAERLGLNQPPDLDKIPVGHMSPITAINFIFASLGVFSLLFPGVLRFKGTPTLSGTLVVFSGFMVSVGYIYETPLLYGGQIIPMAFPTALAFISLGLGLLAASGPAGIPVAFFVGPSVQSRLMRVFLPVIVVILLGQNFILKKVLALEGNVALLSALTAIMSVVIISLVIDRISKVVGGDIDRAIAERRKAEEEREKLILKLQEALANVKQLSGLIPICASCKKIRDDSGYWQEVASYITKHSGALFSHGLCPACAEKAFDELDRLKGDSKKSK